MNAQKLHSDLNRPMLPMGGEPGSAPLSPFRSGTPNNGQMRARFAQRRLGEIMTMLGLLSPKNIETVLTYQREHRLPFGECCRKLQLVAPEGIQRALACQFGFVHALSGNSALPRELILAREAFGPYSEALRAVCGRLGARLQASGRNCLAITSAEPKEGRSHIAANLALAFAQTGWRTLLIDADLRGPSQHRLFDVHQHPGLSRLLCGYTGEGMQHEPAGLVNLTLITSGPVAPNPLELLGGVELPALLRRCRERYDVVLIDTPSSARYADAEVVAAAAGCALVVAAKGRSRIKHLRSLLTRLAESRVAVMGTLMNTY